MATTSAIAAIWSAFGDVFLTMEGQGAVPAFAGTDFDDCAID